MKTPLAAFLSVGLALPSGAQDVTEASTQSARKAARWILDAQRRDGAWGLDAGRAPDVTCTALSAMALMSGGHTERGGPDPEAVAAVRKAVAWVVQQGRESRRGIGDTEETLIQRKLGRTVHVFFAAVLLAQTRGMRQFADPAGDEEVRDLLARLSRSVSQSQEPDGSWHKEAFGSLKATAMAWLALRATWSAGVSVKDATVDKTVDFFRKNHNPATGLWGAGGGDYQTIYATSSALRVLYGLGEGNTEAARRGTEAFLKNIKSGEWERMYLSVEGEDYLSAAMMSQALLHEHGRYWNEWFPWVRDRLVRRQNADGSWVTTACISGKTFPTACAVLCLQTPARLLPLIEN